jgi:hypothetical protein
MNNKHVVFAIGVIGTNRANIKNVTVSIPKQKWYKNLDTNKVSWKKDGVIYLPVRQITSKNIDVIRKIIHEQVDECINKYVDINKEVENEPRTIKGRTRVLRKKC